MDYLLADRYEIPPGAERYYQERVLRMPDDYICYDPPAYAPPVSSLPALEHGRVTFACFNNQTKITPQAVEVWAKILQRVPQSRLVLKYNGMNSPSIARRLVELFAGAGIDAKRLKLLGYSPHAVLLAEYNRMDLALDPFPYCGGLTTCEALWMGVPVITCPGETFASRHSLSHLSSVGLTETIARDLDEYVELAVAWAGDLPRLAGLRAIARTDGCLAAVRREAVRDQSDVNFTERLGTKELITRMEQDKRIMIPVAAGELIDKITILTIKAEHFSLPGRSATCGTHEDAEKLGHVRQELEMLRTVREQTIESSGQLMEITKHLEAINRELWRIEDALRLCERQKDFGERFVELARAVYRNNDQRCALKRRIDELVGSPLTEEKSYVPYG